MESSTITPFLIGERIYLRALATSDLAGPYINWFNDAEVCQGSSHHVYPYVKSAAQQYVTELATTKTKIVLAMIQRDTERHIGNIALQQINWLARTAEFAIIVGDKSCWGKGYGYEAGKLLLAHGFNALNLNRIACGTYANNAGMRALAVKLGMQQEGVRRQAAFKDGDYVDIIEFGLLHTEYE